MNNNEHNLVVIGEELSEIILGFVPLLKKFAVGDIKNESDILSCASFDEIVGEICDFTGAHELFCEQDKKLENAFIKAGLSSKNGFLTDAWAAEFTNLRKTHGHSFHDESSRVNVFHLVLIDAIGAAAMMQQRISKSLRFGALNQYKDEDLNNLDKMVNLTGYLYAHLEFMNELVPVFPEGIHFPEKSVIKKQRIEKWKLHAVECGCLQEQKPMYQSGSDHSLN